ncbi:hypothetical protein BLA29_001989 [Euroglyphus maynei]|uniref:Uncharacterized protein n=1 Tax=Euroglyphus maynei TaxID=6958 RepID=A0A1Y3B420_EURMA|nr:hypothetical protein BLA29_001989 [Euroglyphus maynei]
MIAARRTDIPVDNITAKSPNSCAIDVDMPPEILRENEMPIATPSRRLCMESLIVMINANDVIPIQIILFLLLPISFTFFEDPILDSTIKVVFEFDDDNIDGLFNVLDVSSILLLEDNDDISFVMAISVFDTVFPEH